MRIFKYLNYFLFIAKNWNPRLALFTVYHEIRGEKKYHINTIKIDNLQHQNIDSANLTHASIYQGSNYYLVEKAFDYLKKEKATESIIDFGSGKGRILSVAAFYGFKQITGIDFSEELCQKASANIAVVQSRFPNVSIQIVCEDVANYSIKNNIQVFFFFNPFDEVIMLIVVKKILKSLKENPRKIYIVYLNPLQKEMLLSAGFREEFYLKKMEYLELSILSKDGNEN